MGFLTNLGLAAGRNIITGQEMQQRQADVQLQQQKVQLGNLAIQQQQNQMRTQQDVGQFLQSEMQKDAAAATDPLKASQMYSSAAGRAMADGDFRTANELSEISKGKMTEAREAATYQAKQLQAKKEDLATAAGAYSDNPTPDGARDLMRKAADAGVNPTQIPMPGTPQFQKWANEQQMASMSSKERTEFLEKVAEKQESMRQRQLEHQDRESDVRARMAMTAQMREATLLQHADAAADRKAHLDIERERLNLDEQKFKTSQEGGGKQGVQQQRDIAAVAGAGAETARNIRNMASFGAGTSNSPFTNLGDHKVLDALSKTGSNALTPENVQMFQVSGAGLANQVARIETLGGGRGVTQAQITQLERQIVPTSGDTQVTAAYKLSTAAELAVTRMRNSPAPHDPDLKREWDKTISELDSYVKPDQIYKVASSADRKKLAGFKGSYSQLMKSMDDSSHSADVGLPGSNTGGGVVNTTPLPAGWSVKAH